jgi:hypothetical protein
MLCSSLSSLSWSLELAGLGRDCAAATSGGKITNSPCKPKQAGLEDGRRNTDDENYAEGRPHACGGQEGQSSHRKRLDYQASQDPRIKAEATTVLDHQKQKRNLRVGVSRRQEERNAVFVVGVLVLEEADPAMSKDAEQRVRRRNAVN